MQRKQIFHPYWKWECYQNGMWRKETKDYEEKELPKIIEFTGCNKNYGSAMMEVIKKWRYTIEHNLTDNSINKRAFIGHSACCFKFGWPEYLVRAAWNTLNDRQQYLANKQADKAIESFLKTHYCYAENQITIFSL